METQLALRHTAALKDVGFSPCQTNYEIPSVRIKDAF